MHNPNNDHKIEPSIPAAAAGRVFLIDSLLSYSLGNLAVLPFWYLFFGRNRMGLDADFADHFYELPQEFSAADCIAAVFLGLLIGVFVFVFIRALRTLFNLSPETAQSCVAVPAFAAVMTIVLYVLFRNYTLAFQEFGVLQVDNIGRLAKVGLAGAIVLAGIAGGVFFFRRGAFTAMRIAVLCAMPFGLIMTVNGIAAHLKTVPPGESVFGVDYTLAPVLPQGAGRPKVLFLIFDEWDQRLTFEARRAGLELPNLDRLVAESFVATDMLGAARATYLAIPGLFSGR